jgi:hypothetical protein
MNRLKLAVIILPLALGLGALTSCKNKHDGHNTPGSAATPLCRR